MDRAWVAGLLDGEGHIGIVRTACGAHLQPYRYSAVLRVNQSGDESLLDILHALLGGRGNRYTQFHRDPRNRPSYVLHLGNQKDVEDVLVSVLPFLVSKAVQARHILDFRRVVREVESPYERNRLAAKLYMATRVAKGSIKGELVALREDLRTEYVWLAALVDGEGCISIERQATKGRYPFYLLSVCVVGTDEMLLRRVYAVAGVGDLHMQPVSGQKSKWRWRATARSAVEILSKIHMSLIRKKRQAAVAVRLYRTISDAYPRLQVSEVDLRIREECYQEMHRLNATGVAWVQDTMAKQEAHLAVRKKRGVAKGLLGSFS